MTTATLERPATIRGDFGRDLAMTAATIERIAENQTVVVFERPRESRRNGTVVYNITSEAAFGSIVIRALETKGAATASELARYTGVPELIVRGALQALTAVECLDYDRATGRYALYCELPR
jgi:hypothetical protein